jgi:hypothetical protein
MKLSELITLLKKIEDKAGDVSVVQLDHYGRDVELGPYLFHLAESRHTHREQDVLVFQPIDIGPEPD